MPAVSSGQSPSWSKSTGLWGTSRWAPRCSWGTGVVPAHARGRHQHQHKPVPGSQLPRPPQIAQWRCAHIFSGGSRIGRITVASARLLMGHSIYVNADKAVCLTSLSPQAKLEASCALVAHKPHTHTHTYMHTHTYAATHTHTRHAFARALACLLMCTHRTHAHVCTHTRTHTQCTHMHAHTHPPTHTHTPTHTRTHTHTRTYTHAHP